MGLLDKAVELVRRVCQGASPAGVDSVLPGRGGQAWHAVELAKALRKQIEELWRHRQARAAELHFQASVTRRPW